MSESQAISKGPYEGGLRLSTGMDSLYVLPEHLEDFREVMVAVLMELER